MSYFMKLKKQMDAEQAAAIAATQNAPKEKVSVRLSFWAGEFTFSDGEKKVTGEVKENCNHTRRLIDRANEIAKANQVQLIVQDCGSAVMTECKDYR